MLVVAFTVVYSLVETVVLVGAATVDDSVEDAEEAGYSLETSVLVVDVPSSLVVVEVVLAAMLVVVVVPKVVLVPRVVLVPSVVLVPKVVLVPRVVLVPKVVLVVVVVVVVTSLMLKMVREMSRRTVSL